MKVGNRLRRLMRVCRSRRRGELRSQMFFVCFAFLVWLVFLFCLWQGFVYLSFTIILQEMPCPSARWLVTFFSPSNANAHQSNVWALEPKGPPSRSQGPDGPQTSSTLCCTYIGIDPQMVKGCKAAGGPECATGGTHKVAIINIIMNDHNHHN